MTSRLFPIVLALVLLLPWTQTAWALRKQFDIAPAPAWVEAHAPDTSLATPTEQIANGVHYLLIDQQVRVDGPQRVAYRHVASRAIDMQGVESIANLEIRFYPSFQKLTLHAIQVRRGTQAIPKLATATVRVLQREAEMEALIFDGSMTASVILDDVRVGDVVEYAYSLQGHNPVFGSKHFGSFDLQWTVPVAQVHARLLWPLNRELHLLPLNKAPQPSLTDSATHHDHRWNLLHVAGRPSESDAPSWFDPYPAVQWSEFNDWQSVARWATPLYQLPPRATPRVQAEIARIAARHDSAEQRLVAALLFVQREVRYLGMEIGTGSHAPSMPELVLGRRFGDCKDKTLLTIALLRGLGIQADPVLVNTSQKRAIQGWQPSPGAFNHVVVRARLGDSDVWLDPTRSPQQGTLAELVQADYGPALVIAPQTEALVAMAGNKALTHQRSMRTVLDTRAGFDQPAKYTVTTVTTGAAAESLRASLTSQSRDKLQRQYLNFYARYYEGLEVASALEVTDEGPVNRLTLTERYVIPKFWERAGKNRRLETTIHAPDILDLMRGPRSKVRDAPLSLPYPVVLSHVTEVLLPGRWSGKNDRVHIEDPAFDFERTEKWTDTTLVLTDRFESRADHVAARDVGRYAANLEKARRGTDYTLYYDDIKAASPKVVGTGAGAVYWLPAVAATLALLGFTMFALRVHRWDPEPPGIGTNASAAAPGGLGGWLIVMGLFMATSVFRLGNQLWEAREAYNTDIWLTLTTAGSGAYHALWAPLLLFELVGSLGLMIGSTLATWLFLTRRSSLPRVFLTLVSAAFSVALISAAAQMQIPATAKELNEKGMGRLLGSLASSVFWAVYALRSARMRTTFVRRHRSRPVPAPAVSSATPADVPQPMA